MVQAQKPSLLPDLERLTGEIPGFGTQEGVGPQDKPEILKLDQSCARGLQRQSGANAMAPLSHHSSPTNKWHQEMT